MTLLRPLLVLLLVMLGACAARAAGPARVDDLTIATADGRHLLFHVEMALDDETRASGLMYRRSLAPDGGMLFVWDRPVGVVMWMKNTPLPLDMVFIDERGVIRRIAEMTTPYSLDHIPAGVPVTGVLEVAGGTASHLGIKVGDRVVHSAFP